MKKQDKLALEQYLKKLELIRSSTSVNAFETTEEQKAAIERSKKDVAYMVSRYFPHYASAPCATFQVKFANKVLKEPTIKAFAQWGRGLAKSVWCDVILPFWLWMNDEAHYMVLVGQTYDKGKQLLGDLQAEFEANPQINKDFGEQKLEGSWEDGSFKTRGSKKHGLKPFIGRAAGIGQSVRGLRIGSQRPDLCVVDDIETRETARNPKRQDEYVKWVKEDLVPTMDGPIRRLLYANNRFAPRMIQTELQKQQPAWHVSHVPAYDKATYVPAWPEKYDLNYYRELEGEIGRISSLAEYVQEPQIEGKIFLKEQIIWDELPRMDHLKVIVGHWDIAYAGNSTSDYNAVRIWGLDKNNLFWYIQSFVKQTKMAAAVSYICQVQKSLPNSVIIHWRYESQFWNDEVQRTIDEKSAAEGVLLNITKVNTPKTKKYDRILTMQPRYQNNRIRYNKKMYADNDTQTGLQQLYGIEPGYNTHDDAPDADEQCIGFLEKHISVGNSAGNYMAGKIKPSNERI
jgi:phage terminase large subunit-like protein